MLSVKWEGDSRGREKGEERRGIGGGAGLYDLPEKTGGATLKKKKSLFTTICMFKRTVVELT